MAGDPLEDAFRAELQSVLTAASITWPLKDTENTGVQPKASESWVDIIFMTPTEMPLSFGNPGGNLWRERGEVEIGVFTRRNTGHDELGANALLIRNAFRDRRFDMTTGQSIKIEKVTPMQGGKNEAGWWMRSVLLSYKVTNVG